jgi:hypothetical protein
MLQESGQLAGFRESPDAHPILSGWGGAATAIHAIRQMVAPMTMRLDVDGHDPITIDFQSHAFEWGLTLDEFPARPTSVQLETRPVAAGAPSLIRLPGRTLDPLLWLIGRNAFDGSRAPWLHDGDRYRLSRWPNLAEVGVPLDQVRVIAMLGNTFASAADVAAAAHVSPVDVSRLLNAFSVMGILRRSSGAVSGTTAAVTTAPVAAAVSAGSPTASIGLFGRLLEKLRH